MSEPVIQVWKHSVDLGVGKLSKEDQERLEKLVAANLARAIEAKIRELWDEYLVAPGGGIVAPRAMPPRGVIFPGACT